MDHQELSNVSSNLESSNENPSPKDKDLYWNELNMDYYMDMDLIWFVIQITRKIYISIQILKFQYKYQNHKTHYDMLNNW